jgi:hypothetical protein
LFQSEIEWRFVLLHVLAFSKSSTVLAHLIFCFAFLSLAHQRYLEHQV